MGENAEIYERLRTVENDITLIKERMTWLMRLAWILFPSGGSFPALLQPPCNKV